MAWQPVSREVHKFHRRGESSLRYSTLTPILHTFNPKPHLSFSVGSRSRVQNDEPLAYFPWAMIFSKLTVKPRWDIQFPTKSLGKSLQLSNLSRLASSSLLLKPFSYKPFPIKTESSAFDSYNEGSTKEPSLHVSTTRESAVKAARDSPPS